MNQLDINFTTVVLAVAALVVLIDIIVRLVFMPGRRDRFVSDLLEVMAEPCPQPDTTRVPKPRIMHESGLAECLLRHFAQSGISRRVLSALADANGLTQLQLGLALNRSLTEHGKSALPLAVVRRVALILSHAGLVTLDQGVWRITQMGLAVHHLLHTHEDGESQPAGMRA